ncbi:MAG: glycosyltransferase family 4 protein [Candidatus Portnoybacteria bacterium]
MANNQAVPTGRQAVPVLIFSTAYLPLIGGAEIAVKEITDRIGDFNFDLITARIDGKLKKEERIGNVNVYRIGWGINALDKFFLTFFGFIKALELDKKRNYSIIWSIMASQAGITASFFKIARPDKKLLLTLQEGDEEGHLKRYVSGIGFLYKLLVRPWHLLPFKNADAITTISSDLKKRALENGVKVPVILVPNGVNLEIFKPGEKKDGGKKIVLTVSRLVEKNGVDDLIKAGKYLDFDFKILIIGDGPDRDKLKGLVKKMDLGEKVEFLIRQDIPQRELVKYYETADVFVRPSISEGLGNVFLEAMATGLPIIGTPVGGIPDFLIDRETGLFCQVGNPESVAQKIKEILEDSQLREKLIKNGLELVREKYNWNNIAFKMEEVFQNIIQINE